MLSVSKRDVKQSFFIFIFKEEDDEYIKDLDYRLDSRAGKMSPYMRKTSSVCIFIRYDKPTYISTEECSCLFELLVI